jgi:hypothetical protein
VPLEVPGQTAIAADPSEGALDDPAFGQHDKSMGVTALYDLDRARSSGGGDRGQLRPLITAISEDALNKREASSCLAQHRAGSIAILHIGRRYSHAQQQTEGINEDMPLAAGDLFARIEALRVEPSAPFCAASAVWLSMMATDGLASRPARSRVST